MATIACRRSFEGTRKADRASFCTTKSTSRGRGDPRVGKRETSRASGPVSGREAAKKRGIDGPDIIGVRAKEGGLPGRARGSPTQFFERVFFEGESELFSRIRLSSRTGGLINSCHGFACVILTSSKPFRVKKKIDHFFPEIDFVFHQPLLVILVGERGDRAWERSPKTRNDEPQRKAWGGGTHLLLALVI